MTAEAFLTLDHSTPAEALASHAAISAVIAGYPLLESIRTCHVQTVTASGSAPADSVGYGRAPLNVLGHSAERWTDRNRDIVTPANDLLYTNAWLDLRHGPVVIEVPAQTGRFFVLELLDVYTNNFYNIEPRNCPQSGGCFALMPPGDESEPPPEFVAIRCPSALVWLLGRVLVDDDDDLRGARAFQSGFHLRAPPSAQLPTSVAQWQQGGDPALDFFANLLRAVRDFPPPASQRGVFSLLASVHVELAADGRLADLRSGVANGLRQGHAAAMRMIEAFTRSSSKAAWRYSTRLGRYGDDLMLRAATAFKGLGALAADEAIYASADYDHEGQPMHGAHCYRLHFEDGGQLPADAFWSVTLYGTDRYLAANALGRHALGNRSPLVREADGSLNVYISHRRPLGPEQNWLPAPDAPFYLILRLYHPQKRLLDGQYRFPQVERTA